MRKAVNRKRTPSRKKETDNEPAGTEPVRTAERSGAARTGTGADERPGTASAASAETVSPVSAVSAETAAKMALSGHLRELRNRLLICVGALAACMVGGLCVADRLVSALLDVGRAYGYVFVYLSPQELLLQYVSVSFVCAVCVTLPLTLYELWAFLRPGLKKKERLFYALSMLSGLLCAALGILFAAKALVPFMLRFLMSLNAGSGAQSSVSVQNYVSFLLTIFVIFAVIFELPVATVLLTQLGLLKVEWLKRARKVMIVVIFFVAAVITPPDVVSQIMVAVPLLGLYELSIFVCVVAARLRKPDDESS